MRAFISVLIIAAAVVEGAQGLLPTPASVKIAERGFELNASVTIGYTEEFTDAASHISDQIATLFPGGSIDDHPGGHIFLARSSSISPEGYRLTVSPDTIRIFASDAAGAFYATQTLRQLLPAELERGRPLTSETYVIPCYTIEDEPAFTWRGVMLDPARFFLPKSFVLETIETMALHKLNRLHLHLVDDQGWRIEIDALPQLTRVGAWRDASPAGTAYPTGDAHGGFYTKDDIREILAHAERHHVMVIPEIELPGHAGAAIASYPHLSCSGEPRPVSTRWGVHREVFCAGKDSTFDFFDKVLAEVCELFPGPYVHIGGDECPKDRWKACDHCQQRIRDEGLADEHELQSYVVRRAEQLLHKHGKRLIGWDEILEGGLAPDATVMSWRGTAGGIAAAKQGHDVIMCPTSHCYFDYAQSPLGEPKAIHGNRVVTTVDKVLNFDPIPDELSLEEAKHVLGIQGNLWGEYITGPDHAEYMLYPRLSAIAEIAWHGSADAERFADAWADFEPRLAAMGVATRSGPDAAVRIGTWSPEDVGEQWGVIDWDVTMYVRVPGTYRVLFRYTHGDHRLDVQWAQLAVAGTVAGRDDHNGTTGARNNANVYIITIPEMEADATVRLRARVRSDAGTDSHGEVWIVRDDRP